VETGDVIDNRKIEDELIRRSQSGDDDAFDELVERTKNGAYGLAYRWLRDRELAFDVVQEGFIKLYKALPRWNFSCRVCTWLYRVITNACIDHHRRRRETIISFEALNCPDDIECQVTLTQESPSQQLQRRETAALVERLVTELPERMQQAFLLKYIGGLSLKEISDVQQCSVGTIKASLHQAVQKLRSRLRHHEELADRG